MANWKAELDTLVDETMEFANRVAKTIRPEPRPLIPTIDPADPSPMLDTLVDEAVALANQVVKNHIIEPTGIPPLDVQREEISRRVQLFKAHQQRLTKDREDYAASIVNRMRDLGRECEGNHAVG
jgi:hypothetical protein